MDLAAIRKKSLEVACRLGYPVNESLPLLDRGVTCVVRSVDEIVDRLFAMNCAAACAYGFDRSKALAWFQRETKADLRTDAERRFLESKLASPHVFIWQIQGMWALAWSIQIVAEEDFTAPCRNDFVHLFPDLKKDQPSESFRTRANLRATDELVAALDLAYCLHWAVREAELKGRRPRGKIEPLTIAERRRALEWLFVSEPWEELSLDT